MIVDAGDLFFEEAEIPESTLESEKLKAKVIGQLYKNIGCDAINVGERDLVLGVDFLKEMEETLGLPFVSANLTDANNALLFEPYVIKEVNEKKIGIFGVIGDTSQVTRALEDITGGAVIAQDTLKAAESVVKELNGKVDFIIALTHQGVGRDWVIARRVKGIDLVVGGHDKQKIAEAYEAGDAFIVQSGEKGQYLGVVQITVGADGKKTVENSLIPLGDSVADDAEIKSMITDYQNKVADMYRSDEEKASVPAVSETTCAPCHQDAFAAWKSSDHAHAYNTLVEKERQYNPECLACHTTRFEKPQGFTMKLQQHQLIDVQCESCHGSGSKHANGGEPIEFANPGKEICMECHTEDRCPTFEEDLEAFMQKIAH